MTDTFEKMMAGFNSQKQESNEAGIFEAIIDRLDSSFDDFNDLVKVPAKCLDSLIKIEPVALKGSPAYVRIKKFQNILKEDIKKLDLCFAVTVAYNKKIKEVIAFGSDEPGQLLAMSKLAVICCKMNDEQIQNCVEMNIIIFKVIKEIAEAINQPM